MLCLSTGRVLDAAWRPSPNFDPRPKGATPALVVIHNISLPPGEFGGSLAEALLRNEFRFALDRWVASGRADDPELRSLVTLRVSAHFFLRRDGTLIQLVSLLDRAWHAGRSNFHGRTAVNDISIGIELEGTDTVPYEEAQYERLSRLLRSLMAAWPAIRGDRVVGHCHVAPGRKTDPGPAFAWSRLLDAL